MALDKALAFTLRWEGGYVNHPSDPGGATNKGITQGTYSGWLKANGKEDRPVRLISDDEVSTIYRDNYWKKAGCDQMPEPLDMVVFDCAVNCGVTRALKILAICGHDPIKFIDERDAFYGRLAAANPKMKVFMRGWLNRTSALREEVKKYVAAG